MSIVEVLNPRPGVWMLLVSIDGQVIKVWTFKRLVEVIDLACTLQIHITNVESLPIRQYKGA